MANAHKVTLEKANSAVTAGDYEGFLSFCAEDTEWTFVGDRTLEGKEAVRRWMRTTYTTPPRLTVHRMISEGELHVATGTVSVMDQGGSYLESSYCDVWRFRDGKMAELTAFVVESRPEREGRDTG